MIQSTQELKKKFTQKFETRDLQLIDEPSTLFHPIRIIIMKTLYKHAQVDFRDLKKELRLTAGNLASHLRVLIDADYLITHKEIVGNRPRTTVEITEKGRIAFERFKSSLKGVLENE